MNQVVFFPFFFFFLLHPLSRRVFPYSCEGEIDFREFLAGMSFLSKEFIQVRDNFLLAMRVGNHIFNEIPTSSLNSPSPQNRTATIEFAFHVLDADNDGKISLDELWKGLRKAMPSIRCDLYSHNDGWYSPHQIARKR